ncbi:MAG: cytochrome P450 [Gammaproteobacteria bacterium]|nr:cytochrome P450 [Gammaproteobacteria bacterium]
MLHKELEGKAVALKKSNPCEYITNKTLDLTRKSLDLLSWLTASNTRPPQRFKDAIFLSADPHFGQILKACHSSGKGLGDIIIKEARKKLMEAEEQKDYSAKERVTWRFGSEITPKLSQFVLLVQDPQDIEKVLQANKENNHDSSGSFPRILGPKTIFAQKADSPEYAFEKKRFKSLLFNEDALSIDIEKMKTYTKDFFEEMKNTINVQEFAKHYTMGIIGKTKLGIESMPDDVKKQVSTKITEGSIQLANIRYNLLLSILPFTNWSLFSNFYSHLFDRKLKNIVSEGDRLVREKIIKSNKESILQEGNWVTLDKAPNEIKSIDLNSDATLKRLKELLIVGHDTTANILEFALKFLADHPNIYAALRREVDTDEGNPLNWKTVKDSRLTMLTAVILETLRLQPSVAIMINTMAVDCKLREDDTDFLRKGDIVFFSQYLTHRSKKLWGPDANEFNPYRFIDTNGKIKQFSPYQFFPFGFNPRLCLGQNMAKFEIAMCLAYVVKNYDLILHRDKEHDPYEVDVIFTLKSADKACLLEFVPRECQPSYKLSK